MSNILSLTIQRFHQCSYLLGVVNWFVLFMTFWLGAVFASGAMCFGYRKRKKMSWVTGRSRCDQCGTPIPFRYNIPIISCLVLHGRCPHCKCVFGYHHAVIEAFGGFAFLVFFVFAFTGMNILQILFILLVYAGISLCGWVTAK